MYDILLFIHSWVRWVVLIAIAYMLVRAYAGWFLNKPWTGTDNYLVWATAQMLTYQAIFGLTLYLGVSPVLKTILAMPELLRTDPVMRFWGIRHGLTMLAAVGVFHMGKAKLRKQALASKHRYLALTLTVVCILIFSAVPWPGLVYGRNLFRWMRY